MGSIDLAALEIFKAVAEQGGITKAAVRLHRVQSNVTTRVKQLEERLGTRLFFRQRRRLVLSPEGKLLLEYADRLLRLSAEAEAALRDDVPRGVLRIGALESVAATRLPPILSRYHRAHPDVRIELVTGTTGALIARVLDEEVEAALVAEPFTANDLETMPAFVEELVLITPRRFPPIRTPKDIGHTTLIAFANGCSYRRRLEAWLAGAGVAPERVMEFGSYHAIVACVAAGAGIAVVPRSIVRVSRVKGDIVAHSLPAQVAKARTVLVWRRDRESVALAAMKTELRAAARRS
ncbi:MAG TPA: LysR substrate-binding domain-containing protein [Candidatus Methylomirabilis sp.]|nr:LysR substrate-binding domain-containing protein [Candidatus Methylomirabilis sp.]